MDPYGSSRTFSGSIRGMMWGEKSLVRKYLDPQGSLKHPESGRKKFPFACHYPGKGKHQQIKSEIHAHQKSHPPIEYQNNLT